MGTKEGAGLPAQGDLPDEMYDAPDGYQSLARIGEGGFAIVYRGLDSRFDRLVALKVLRSDSLDERQLRRFSAECLAIGRVSSHPNIVTVYDAGTTPARRPWLAMEYCSGGSLAQKVARQGPLPVHEVITIGVRLCNALTAAHEAGILHRDVKPHNVLLTAHGEPALADFGIASVPIAGGPTAATATTVAAAAAAATAGTTTAYTVVHAAPEILEGRAGTAAADIYSLGSTLYTLLAGQAPFAKEASTGLAPLVTRILRNDLPVITRPGVPPELEKLLRRSMAARPADRPASAAELGASLDSLGRRLAREEATGPMTSARPAAPPTSGRRLLFVLGGVLGLLLAAFMTLGFSAHDPRPGAVQPRAVLPNKVPPNTNPPNTVLPNTGTQTATTRTARAAAEYAPRDLNVARGRNAGELTVTWRLPIRPDVVATVIYEGVGTGRARAIVSYPGGAQPVPAVTLHGLPRGRQVCLYAAHVVSIGERVTNAVSRPVCAVPR